MDVRGASAGRAPEEHASSSRMHALRCLYFPKYVRDICLQLGICGWVKNSKTGTILGKMQGPRPFVDQMTQWLSNVGSPGSEIHHCDFTNWETVSRQQYKGFAIRF
ncbi:acylphosphatase-2 isoform X1 [Nomia melanderi]|uniref:acylphosphatase-2 isoform X1 n=1 Tax=Nomia melanderi TaxID=2448451 RepID=UPI0013044E03|nr:acylphosphatase-2 isoform X1 [Nomia melanderi]